MHRFPVKYPKTLVQYFQQNWKLMDTFRAVGGQEVKDIDFKIFETDFCVTSNE